MEIAHKLLIYIFITIQLIIALYLLMPFFLLIFHALIPKKYKSLGNYKVTRDKDFDFAAIVTAHQDTRFIAPFVDSFCKQTYSNFVVYVIADACDISGLQFNDERIRIIKPENALNAKIKSIKYAVDNFVRPHDVLVVFDADNLVHPKYFENLNKYYKRGFRAVQTHMLSKNTETVFAKLDSIGHIYNTFVERQSKMDFGLSSSITGSGISLETELYKQVMYKDGLGGFDKKLQADIVSTIPQLAFATDVYVYDEKVDDGKTLERQRTRWIYTYFKYFPVNWKLFVKGWRTMNFNLIFFGFNVLRPPLFITIGAALLTVVLVYFINPVLSLVWLGILLLYVVSFVLIILTQSHQKGMGEALIYIPVVVMRQVSALFKMQKATKDFLKTDHAKIIYIDDLLKNETI